MTTTKYYFPVSLRACCRRLGCFCRPNRRFKSSALLAAFISTIFAITSASAAFVTLKEAEMDAIFGQVSFGANPIDIRYLPTITHVDPNLLNINTAAKLTSAAGLFNLFNSSTVHYAYFVDSISYCGGVSNAGIVGCGDTPGDDYVIESNYAAIGLGAELMAHELAHNLALGHHPAPNNDNLMDAVVGSLPGPPATTNLTVAQAGTILTRPSVQTDVNGKFIEIQPVLIVASLVPEPSTLALIIFGMSTLGFRRRRR